MLVLMKKLTDNELGFAELQELLREWKYQARGAAAGPHFPAESESHGIWAVLQGLRASYTTHV